jgi:hypothetical protein
VYKTAQNNNSSPFHESPDVDQANVMDILQEIIDQGFPVLGLEVSTGWIEIHNRQDIRLAEQELV